MHRFIEPPFPRFFSLNRNLNLLFFSFSISFKNSFDPSEELLSQIKISKENGKFCLHLKLVNFFLSRFISL